MNTININLQNLIVGILGVTLISLVIMRYNTEIILALITGLVGVLTPLKTNTNNTITTSEAIQKLSEDPTIEIKTITEENEKEEETEPVTKTTSYDDIQ